MESFWTKEKPCGACGAKAGQFHARGCDMEKCSRCGCQRISCECLDWPDAPGRKERLRYRKKNRLPWTGINEGVSECIEYGWFSRRNPDGSGYVPCGRDDFGSGPDLNRLVGECEWDHENRRWIKPEGTT